MFKLTCAEREITKDDYESVANYIIENADAWEEYNDMLDECNDMVEICGLTYFPSVAFERVDPIAYRLGYDDYMDSVYSDICYEINRMQDGDTCEWFGIEIECLED